MKRPTHVVLRRKKADQDGVMSVYNDSKWEVPNGYPPRPTPPPPHPGPHPRPPKPDPWDPPHVDPAHLKVGMGLQLDGDILSVKLDERGDPGLKLSPYGLSLNDAVKKIDRQEKKINELTAVIVDLKSQINKLKLATSPSMIAKALAATYDIFVMEDGKLRLSVGAGLRQDDNGTLSVDAGSGLTFENGFRKLAIDSDTTIVVGEDNEFGVNIDNDTIKVNEAGQITASGDTSWKEYKTN